MKLYKSQAWLRNEYVNKRRTIYQIAEYCGVSHTVIQYWITKFNLRQGPS